MHTHATVLHNMAGAAQWKHIDEDIVALATAPFFHVTGLDPQLPRRRCTPAAPW